MESKNPSGAITALLRGDPPATTPPIWFMRQAGRYLPEYRALREKAGSFLNLCFNPELAMTVTLQPLQRFDLSAAIIFSDILVVPLALGMGLDFQENEGPILEKEKLENIIRDGFDDAVRDRFFTKIAPLLTAIAETKKNLPADKDLIGFAGAPWTLFCYMVVGRSSPDFAPAVAFAKNRPDDFKTIINILTNAVIDFLLAQKKAGADVVKIFDSWANLIPDELLPLALYQPHQKIIAALKNDVEKNANDATDDVVKDMTDDSANDVAKNANDATKNKNANHNRLIVFPKGIADIKTYQAATNATAIAIDHHADMVAVQNTLPANIILQGNLDPALLQIGGTEMTAAALKQLGAMKNKSYIFNLGHGIDKTTPIDHVTELVRLVKNFS